MKYIKNFVNIFVCLCIAAIMGICIYYLRLTTVYKISTLNSGLTTGSFSPTVNLAIIQMTNEKTVKKVAESIRNKREYAHKHNYTLIEDEPSGNERMAKWYKLQSVLKAFKDEKNEWVWMLDTDTIVTNLNIKIGQLTSLATHNNFHIIMSFDCANINTGSVLFRNTNLSKQFIIDAWNTYGKEVGVRDEMCDNNGIIAAYKNIKDSLKKHFLFVPQISINSYPIENTCQKERSWQSGDFLIHFAGMHNEQLFFKYVDLASKIKNENLAASFTTEKWLEEINHWQTKYYNLSLFP